MDYRKMIAALAVAASATGFAIESSNVVGYQQVSTPAGYSMRAATFQAISGDYKISEIQVTGVDIGYGSEYGQVVNADGTWGDTYYYLTEDSGAPANGWYKDAVGDEPVTDADTLAVGQAFFFSASVDVEMTYAGQVIKGKPVILLPAGYSMLGNPTPVTVKIGEIEVAGSDIGYGSEYGQIVDPSGAWGDTYYYLTEDSGAPANGWYKDAVGDEPVTDEDVLVAGNSLFFCSSADVTVTLPAAID